MNKSYRAIHSEKVDFEIMAKDLHGKLEVKIRDDQEYLKLKHDNEILKNNQNDLKSTVNA